MTTAPTSTDAAATEAEVAVTDTDQPAAATRRSRAWAVDLCRLAPLYAPAVMIAVAGWVHRWTDEDAFINFRIIDNLFAGNGPVFNAGERIEAGTSPLWIAILAIGRLLFGWFFAIEWISVGIGLTAAVAAFVVAAKGVRLAVAGPGADGDAVIPLGLLIVGSVTAVWDFATSGLEMSLVWLWIATCWYLLCRLARGGTPTGRRRALAAATIGLAPLIRPDLMVMLLCFAAAWFLLVRPRRLVADLAAMFALPVIFQIFRMGYYASLVPSTALAKDAGGLHMRQGSEYLRNFVGPYYLWVPLLIVVAVVGWQLNARRDGRIAIVTLAMMGAALSHGGYIVAIGGDYMHGRLLLPAFFAFAVPAGVEVRRVHWPSLALAGAAAVWSLVAIVSFRPPLGLVLAGVSDWRTLSGATVMPPEDELAPTGIRAVDLYDSGVRGYIRVLEGEALPGRDPEALVVTLGSIGIPAYQLGIDVWVVDIGGLAEPLAARTDPTPGAMAGHRKTVNAAWYDARFGVVGGDDEAAQAAALALSCGPVDGLLDAVTEDLTPGRFLSNIWRSPSYTRLHIPADPADAVRMYC